MNSKIRNKFSTYAKEILSLDPENDPCQQHFREEVKINNIIAKYNKTGIISHVAKTRKVFGEFRDLADGIQDLDKVVKAQQAFDTLPPPLKKEFGDIKGFFEYLGNEKNHDQLVQWGIFDAPSPTFQNTPTPGHPGGGSSISEPSPGSKKDGSPKKTPKISTDE